MGVYIKCYFGFLGSFVEFFESFGFFLFFVGEAKHMLYGRVVDGYLHGLFI